LLVIANMIGSGVFTTTGFMASGFMGPDANTQNVEGIILMVWVAGGLLALCGALCYGELSTLFPRSGGEYTYLSRMYHPALGFLSGWASLIVGFSAPIAGNALVIGGTLAAMFGMQGTDTSTQIFVRATAFGIVAALTVLHAVDVKKGAATQNLFTVLKVALVLFFIVAGLFVTPETRSFSVFPAAEDFNGSTFALFAFNLVFVYFAYSGWNAAAYIAGEIKNPQRNVPLSLLVGTGVVAVLYVLLNYVFLYVAAPAEIAGQEDFAHTVANKIFGANWGWIISSMVAFALVSSTSSMVMAGPRVTAAIGEDFSFFRSLARKSKGGTPVMALMLQLAVAGGMILYGNVQSIFIYIGFTLSIFAFLTVLGLLIHRFRYGKPQGGYTTPGFPFTPLLFLVMVGWLIVWSFLSENGIYIALTGFGTLGVGLLIYWLAARGGSVAAPNRS
jgi:APA family basic amino acid/polyamine antiporter